MTSNDPEYSLFTSLRYDPELILTEWNNKSPLMLMPYHVERLQQAARRFSWDNAIKTMCSDNGSERFKQACKAAVQSYKGEDRAHMIRVLLHRSGELEGEILPTKEYPYDLMFHASFNPEKEKPKFPEFCLAVYLDSVATPSSIFTSSKTTNRIHYTQARERAGIASRQEPKEVILYNQKNEITEGSVSNVSFWIGGIWVTPAVETGCLPGTTRRWMVEQGYVKEGIIMKNDLQEGDYVLVTNGAVGIQLGRITNHVASVAS